MFEQLFFVNSMLKTDDVKNIIVVLAGFTN
jgi:hypothetical protein